jgi:hypothetical protein
MANPCTPINFDVLDWLLTNTQLKDLPDAAKTKLKSVFPSNPLGPVGNKGKMCLAANSITGACNETEKKQKDCCKFKGDPFWQISGVPDVIKFSIGAGPAAVSIDVKLIGAGTVNVVSGCVPPQCRSEKASGKAILRVEGTMTIAGASSTVGANFDLNQVCDLECGK